MASDGSGDRRSDSSFFCILVRGESLSDGLSKARAAADAIDCAVRLFSLSIIACCCCCLLCDDDLDDDLLGDLLGVEGGRDEELLFRDLGEDRTDVDDA